MPPGEEGRVAWRHRHVQGEFVIIAIGRRQRARKYAAREPEAVSAAVTRAMHEAMDAMGPIREAARGLRGQLEADGFSPSAAEWLAAKFVAVCMKNIQLTVAVDIGCEHEGDPRAEADRR